MTIILDKSVPLTLAELMGTMMSAVIDAEAESARTTVDFIRTVGFFTDSKDKKQKLNTVQFGYKKLDENNVISDFHIDLPLLSMVNIPMVSVKKASFSFSFQNTSAEPEAKATGRKAAAGSLEIPRALALIKGRLVKKSAPGQEKANLEVLVELERPEMPIGVDKILEILELSATSTKEKTD